ncbi:MAG: GNAT family N-acetyltransferase [Pseudomonadota bacterium]
MTSNGDTECQAAGRAASQPPVIITTRLILRGFEISDLEDFYALYADRAHAQFVSHIADREAAFDKLASLIGHWHLRGFGRFAVADRTTGQVIGHCGASQRNAALEPEVNYTFAPQCGGQGLATEAVINVLRHYYRDRQWTTAISVIDARNERSIALAARVGATYEGVQQYGAQTLQVYRHLPASEFLERFYFAPNGGQH